MSTTNTYVPGRTLYVKFSDDNWTTTYTAVCLSKQGLSRSRAVVKQDNQCEMAKAFGQSDGTMPLELLNNLTPNATAAGVGEASYKKFSSWYENNTSLKMKRQVGDGSNFYQESACRIAKIDDSVDVSNNMTFNIEIELEGALDETA